MRRLARRGLARGARPPITAWPKRRAVEAAVTSQQRDRGAAFLMALGGGGLAVVSAAAAYTYTTSSEPIDVDAHPRCGCCARVERFDALAETYDDEIGVDELVMGLPLLRRWLLRRARGDVLEVACGTGRNLELYPAAVTSIVATDASDAMVRVTATKAATLGDGRISVRRAAVETVAGAYDTVVDTFGLCSVDDPVAALQAMAGAVRPGGEVLLLEHGRAHYAWLNRLLDRHAAQHLLRWGCSWNRDYVRVIEQAGLEVVSLRRFHLGTTVLAVVRAPPPGGASCACGTCSK